MTRRALSPAAHGVLLAVRAALRGRVPQITDAADGTTTAVVLDPDGTRILRCEVRSTSRARDTRQPLLPLAPGPQHTPPAPVAVVTDRAALDEIKAAAQRAEAVAAQGDPVRYEVLDREPERESSAVKRLAVRGKWCVLVRRAGQLFELHGAYKTEAEAESADRSVAEQSGVCDVLIVTPSRSTKGTRGHAHHGYAVEGSWTVVASTDHHGWHRWLCVDEATAMRVRYDDADAVAGVVVVSVFDPSGTVRRVPEAPAVQDDDGPAPINGVCAGDRLTLDDEPIEVMGVDAEGFTWRTIAIDTKGRSVDEGDVLWREVVEGRPGHWRVTEVEAHASREKPLRPAKPVRTKVAKSKAHALPGVVVADTIPVAGPVLDDTEALWEIVLDDWPAQCRTLDLLDAETAVLWTRAAGPGDHLRTIVPGKHVPTIRTRALDVGAVVLREEPSDGPNHLVRVGDEIATPKGVKHVAGITDEPGVNNAVVGLVLEDGAIIAWLDTATVVEGRVQVAPVGAWTAERDGDGWRAVCRVPERPAAPTPSKPKAATKAKLARLVAVPQADDGAAGYRGAIVIVWQATEGAAWERVWSASSPKAAEIDSAWKAACEAHRARQYNRGGRCTRDSLDGAL